MGQAVGITMREIGEDEGTEQSSVLAKPGCPELEASTPPFFPSHSPAVLTELKHSFIPFFLQSQLRIPSPSPLRLGRPWTLATVPWMGSRAWLTFWPTLGHRL